MVSVCALSLDVGWDDTAGSLSRSDTRFVPLAIGPAPPYVLSQVDFVRFSDDTRIDVLHIVPSVCLRVPTRTLCSLAMKSIFLGLPHRHR